MRNAARPGREWEREPDAMPAHIMREEARATLRFTYDADVVDALKVRIPSRFRKWMPDEKSWVISDPWVTTAENLLREKFGTYNVTVEDRRSGATPPPPPAGDPPPRSRFGEAEVRRLREELAREKAARLSAQRDAARFRADAGRSSSSADWAGELYRRLPPGMRDSVYKRLMTALHPGAHGGDPAAVTLTPQLNGAFRAPKSGR